jgi:hypothetical protein
MSSTDVSQVVIVDIRLTHKEAEILHKILDSYLSDLRVEIANTDLVGFCDPLKKENVFIEELLLRLETAGVNIAL